MNSTVSFKPDNFCKKVNKIKCLNYECDEKKMCSVDEKSCVHLIRWEKLMKAFFENELDRKIFNNFIKNIKVCQDDHLKYFNTDNYCKKETNNKIECEMYTCGRNYCSNSKKSCEHLIILERILNLSKKHDMKQKKMIFFLNNIPSCLPNGRIHFKTDWTHKLYFV